LTSDNRQERSQAVYLVTSHSALVTQSTPQGARLEGNTILVEQDRLIVGSDPLGIYEFERPDKKILK